MQNALGIAGCAGSVDRIGGVVLAGRFKAGERLCVHDFVPVGGGELYLASAVGADKVDALGGVCIFHQRPCRAGLPDADHGDDRQNAAGQVDEDKVLAADAVVLQISIDAAAHIV